MEVKSISSCINCENITSTFDCSKHNIEVDIDKVCSFLKLEQKALSIKARNRIKIQYPIERRKEEFKNSLTEINSNE